METGGIKGNDSRKTLLECLSSIVVKTATGAEDEKKFNPSVYEDAKEDISEAGAYSGRRRERRSSSPISWSKVAVVISGWTMWPKRWESLTSSP